MRTQSAATRSLRPPVARVVAAISVVALVAIAAHTSSTAERARPVAFETLASTALSETMQATSGSIDTFLKISGIPGESQDSRHRDEIEIHSWSWGVSNGVTPGSSSAGKPSFETLQLSASTSKASPLLMLATASGQHIPEAVMTVRKAGEAQPEFLTITLEDVFVSSLTVNGGGSAAAAEQLSLSYNKITVEYRAQRPDGSLEPPIVASWDVRANKPG